MPITFSQSHYYAVEDARSQAARDHLLQLPGDVGRLIRLMAEYNTGKRDEYKTDRLHEVMIGRLSVVDDLPVFGDTPAAWRALYEPWRAAMWELEAADTAFLALWQRAIGRLLPADEDDQEARRLVAAIEAQRDAVIRPVGDLQRLRCALLPDALTSWLTAIQADNEKLPALEKTASAAEQKAQQARNAVNAVQSHREMARGQMQALGKEMLGTIEHKDKWEQLAKLLGIRPAAPTGKVLYPTGGHVQPYAAPADAPAIEHVESPW